MARVWIEVNLLAQDSLLNTMTAYLRNYLFWGTVSGMDSIEGNVAQLATMQELILWAILTVACVAMLIIGTWHGNSDIWDKIGQEMKTLNKAFWATVTSWRWLPELIYRTAAMFNPNPYLAQHRVMA